MAQFEVQYEETMDYTRYKLERSARRKSEREDGGYEFMPGADKENSDGQDHTGLSNFSGSDLSPAAHRPKSILKVPTVRFKVNDETNENLHVHPVFPGPQPPTPSNGQPFAGMQPVLYDSMPPLPPGPPQGLYPFTSGPDGTPQVDPVANSLYMKFMNELDEFVSMQDNVIRARVHVQERRTKLRLYRENVSRHDVDYMNHLRECKAKGTVAEDAKLEELFEAAQTARDEVGPEELEYEALDIKLGADEFALKEKYDSLENRFENFFKLRKTSTTNNTVPETIEFEPPSEVSDGGEERQRREQEPRQYSLFQGAFIGDQVKVGQHPLAGDSYGGSAPVPETSHEGIPTGARFSSDAHEPGQPYTSNVSIFQGEDTPPPVRDRFVTEPDNLDISWLESETQFESGEVRMKFSLQGLDLPPIEESAERFLDDLEVDFSFGDGDSLLLLGSDSDTQSTLSDYLLSFNDTRNRVNRWLLHKLRSSPLEVFELRRKVLDSSDPVPDWANLALSLWESDKYDGFRLEESPAPYPSTRDLPKRHRWRRKQRSSSTKPNPVPLPDNDLGPLAFDPATRTYVRV